MGELRAAQFQSVPERLGNHSAMTIANGNPAITYYDASNTNLNISDQQMLTGLPRAPISFDVKKWLRWIIHIFSNKWKSCRYIQMIRTTI